MFVSQKSSVSFDRFDKNTTFVMALFDKNITTSRVVNGRQIFGYLSVRPRGLSLVCGGENVDLV